MHLNRGVKLRSFTTERSRAGANPERFVDCTPELSHSSFAVELKSPSLFDVGRKKMRRPNRLPSKLVLSDRSANSTSLQELLPSPLAWIDFSEQALSPSLICRDFQASIPHYRARTQGSKREKIIKIWLAYRPWVRIFPADFFRNICSRSRSARCLPRKWQVYWKLERDLCLEPLRSPPSLELGLFCSDVT